MIDTNILKVPMVRIKQVRQKTVSYNAKILAPESIVDMVAPLYKDIDREQFTVVGLNAQNQPNVVNIVSVGTLHSAPVASREVFKALILSNCLSFICVHNHVGGSLEPSSCDIDVTKTLSELGAKLDIRLLDHIILGLDGNYYSFSKSDCMPPVVEKRINYGT